jgi:hypothetical protein
MKKAILVLLFLTLSVSCKSKAIDIKSPCVSNEGGPCGPKKQINEWWLKNSQNHQISS